MMPGGMFLRLTSWLHYTKNNQYRMDNTWAKLRQWVISHPLLGGGIIISLMMVSVVGIFYFWNLAPVDFQSGERQLVEIPFGASLRQISQQLETKGIIRNRFVYEIYVRLDFKARMARSGRYLLGPGMSVPRIANELTKGTTQDIRVTIPEGLTNKEVADLLGKKGIVDRERFLKLLADPVYMATVLKDLNQSGLTEGYLYPDTYRFSLDTTEETVIETMVARFRQIFKKHLPQVSSERLKDILIMASIIEEEAQKAEERPLIAGVFYNRLQQGYPLQSCATVQYALGTHKKRLLYKDLQVDSPYNTYKNYGLPPGPIANPGLSSLLAAANPARVQFLYFVAKPDGSHVFSRTYAEHLRAQRNIERSSQ